jgi:CRP-like cAMP-binding protein
MALHIRGDMADLPSIALAESVSGLEALSDVSLLRVPLAALRQAGAAHPAIAAALWRDGAVDAAIQVEWATNVGRKSARSKLAHLFCEMAARYEQVGMQVGLGFELPMTQQQLADAIAITLVHLNRTLMSLRADGILEMRHRIVQIFDWPVLTKLAGFDPSYLHFRIMDGKRMEPLAA